jgi:hypothetical protein
MKKRLLEYNERAVERNQKIAMMLNMEAQKINEYMKLKLKEIEKIKI